MAKLKAKNYTFSPPFYLSYCLCFKTKNKSKLATLRVLLPVEYTYFCFFTTIFMVKPKAKNSRTFLAMSVENIPQSKTVITE